MATTSTNINFRVDGEIKTKAQEVFSQLGLDMTTAMNLFLRQVIKKNGIPFELTNEPTTEKKYLLDPDPSKPIVFGRLKGTFEIPDDFDEPLEEMKEYMY